MVSYRSVAGFHVTEQIGGGGFSKVFRAVNMDMGSVAAIKVVSLTEINDPSQTQAEAKTKARLKELQKETAVHAVLKHPNVIAFIESLHDDGRSADSPFPALYILLEWAPGGDLFDKIAPEVGVEESLAHFYFTQLVNGLSYCHDEGVCHRDLKPENLLLSLNGDLKISDFGLCSVFKYKGKERLLSERCGSLPYVAPELAVSGNYRAEPVDVWGAGVVLYTLLAGNTPWDQPTKRSAEFQEYVDGSYIQYEPWSRFAPDALSILQHLLHIDPKRRITLEQIKKHPWFLQQSDLHVKGRCRDQLQLATSLMTGLKLHGDLAVAEPAAHPSSQTVDQYEAPVMLAAQSPSSEMVQDSTVSGKGRFSASQPQLMREEAISTTQGLSQFTQTLTLCSATAGNRMLPNLTRFFSASSSAELVSAICQALDRHKIQHVVQQLDGITMAQTKDGEHSPQNPPQERTREGGARIKIATQDKRKLLLQGTITIERIARNDAMPDDDSDEDEKILEDPTEALGPQTLVIFARSKGSPLSWRQFFRDITGDSHVQSFVFRTQEIVA